MFLHRLLATSLLGLFLALAAAAKDAKEPPAQVMVWPPSGAPVVRFSFGKFKGIGVSGNRHNYTTDVTAENLWGKRISSASFYLYLFDKNKVRIGEGWLSISNLGPGEVVKFETTIDASGVPVTISLVPQSLPPELQSFLPPKTVPPISVTVNSVPQGAELKVDGVPAGVTPKLVQAAPGKHVLEFSKEGFNTGKFPLEIGPNDVSGGVVSFELGTFAHDTLELRDGSVLTGDLESISATEAVVRVGGSLQHLDRNQVKRIVLVERDPPAH